MAFDRHMNLVLGDSEEFRKLPPKKGKSDDEVSALRCACCTQLLHIFACSPTHDAELCMYCVFLS